MARLLPGRLALGAAVLCSLGWTAVQAQSYPSRPIRMVVPFPAGGSTDATARLIAEPLGQALGQPVIVENRPGANGNIAAEQVARAPADGYTLFFATSAILTINPALYRSLRFDSRKDFQPVAMACTNQVVLVANPAVAANTLPEVIRLARAKPGGLTFGSTGNGGIAHLAGEMLNTRAGISLRHIPYKGAAPAMQDLLGGQVDLMFDALATSLPQIETGRLKAIAIPRPTRFAGLPQVPTFAEAGIADFDVSVWNGVVAPTGTPMAIVERLNREVNSILERPEIRDKLVRQGLEPAPASVDGFRSRMEADLARWPAIVKAAGATLD